MATGEMLLQTAHHRLASAHTVGYRAAAFNHIVQSRFEPSLHRNPFFRADKQGVHSSRPPFPLLDPRTSEGLKSKDKGKGKATESPPGAGRRRGEGTVRQLSRMTLVLDENSFGKAGHGLTNSSSSALLTYDLLAVRPLTETAFSQVCTSLTELKPISIDIISLDLAAAPRLPFILRRSTLRAAIANGAVFEVCYADALRSAGSHGGSGNEAANIKARTNLMSGTRELLRVTNGKGIILSSGAADMMGLRGPHDVINLAAVLGMNPSAARDSISATCASLLARAETRKTYRGIVGQPTIVPGQHAPLPSAIDMDLDPSAAVMNGTSAALAGGKKRKLDDGEASDDLAGPSGHNSTAVQPKDAHAELKNGATHAPTAEVMGPPTSTSTKKRKVVQAEGNSAPGGLEAVAGDSGIKRKGQDVIEQKPLQSGEGGAESGGNARKKKKRKRKNGED